MAHRIPRILTTFLLSSLLTIGGLARADSSWLVRAVQKDKEKGKEPIPEKPKPGGDRGGRGDDKKDDKKGGKKP